MSPNVNSISTSFGVLIPGAFSTGEALILTELNPPRLEKTVKDAIEADKVFLIFDFIVKPTF